MAEKQNFKVSYVKITDDGLERHNDVYLLDISNEDKKDIKAITFLPIVSSQVVDITSTLKGLPLLEEIFLPSTMTTTIKRLKKECPMLKSLLILSHDPIEDALDKNVVRVTAREENGDNSTEFRTFVETSKDGSQTFFVNSKQIKNHDIEVVEHVVERLTLKHVEEYICGESGIMAVIDEINAGIEDERYKIDISQETLESLLGIFVDKGITFEEFTIDFSKLYDKIESYKTIAKTVNQVTIKEEVEGNIVETYQNVLRVHYENLLKKLSERLVDMALKVDADTQDTFVEDLKVCIAQVIVENPVFDEDYRGSEEFVSAIEEMPVVISRNVRSSKERSLLRTYLIRAVSELKDGKEDLFARIDRWLDTKIDVAGARDVFAKAFRLNLEDSPSKKLADTFINSLIGKNFGTLTKNDVDYVIERIKNGISESEISGKELIKLIKNEVDAFVTKEDMKNTIEEVVGKKGYRTEDNI